LLIGDTDSAKKLDDILTLAQHEARIGQVVEQPRGPKSTGMSAA